LDEARRQALSEIKALLRAHDEVSKQQLGLDGRILLAMPIPGRPWRLHEYREAIEQAETSSDHIADLRAMLEDSWMGELEEADAVS
jgi:hypothetical protein